MLNRILVIDDSITIEYMLRYLSKEKWPELIIEMYDPQCKIPEPTFDWGRYDLLFLDYDLGLKNENGLDWLYKLKKNNSLPTTIMLTGYASQKLENAAKKLGAELVLDKNILTPESFVDEIDNILQKHYKDFEKTKALSREERQKIIDSQKSENQESPEFEKTMFFLQGDNENQSNLVNSEPGQDLNKNTGITVNEFKSRPSITSSLRKSQQPKDIPIIIPGYHISEKIGQGGMASIYLAERDEDGIKVVLKVLTLDGEDESLLLRRFMREYKLIAQIQHPNVVQIYERAFASNFAYIAMEHFTHGDLADRLKQALDSKVAINYLQQITRGLGAAHEKGIVHRDMKPANILFRSEDNLAITDFGIAKSLENERMLRKELTFNGELMGTIYYISPEQIQGAEADQRSDIYGLGIIMYKMLTGNHPYVGNTQMEIFDKHVHAPIPLLPEKYASLQPLLNGLLEKDPDERFQSTEDLLIGLNWDDWA